MGKLTGQLDQVRVSIFNPETVMFSDKPYYMYLTLIVYYCLNVVNNSINDLIPLILYYLLSNCLLIVLFLLLYLS